MGVPVNLGDWRLSAPALPDHLRGVVAPDDPAWFARELAIAAAPPWRVWRFMLRCSSWPLRLFGRLEVTGGVPAELRQGPLLLAANHVGDFDPFVVAAALHRVGVLPRIMATGGILSTPVAGPLLERSGGIRVERGTDVARHAVRITEVALAHGGHVLAYPEGRVGLAPDGWPERGRTGLARLALGAGVPVIPVSQWGAQEVLQYADGWGKLRSLARSVVTRPLLQVHVGPPVHLQDLRQDRVGDANRARARIAAAITRGLARLRQHPDARPWSDPTRPLTGTAAFPGGFVPGDIP